MPRITRQKPNDQKRTETGSVLDEAIEIGDIRDVPIKMVIYGQNRTGKTTLACLFPKPLLLISFEPTKSGGAMSVKKYPGVKFLHLSSSEKAMRLVDELKGRNPFKSVVIDSATSFQDVILKEILDLPAVPEQLNWGTVSQDEYRQRSEKCRECLRPFINLECHTIITAKERDHNANKEDRQRKILRRESLESFFAADLGGATAGWLHDACDYIGRLYLDKEVKIVKTKVKFQGKVKIKEEEVETGRTVRRLRTMYHPNYAAGFRSADPESVPEWIEAVTPQQMYDRVMAAIRGEKIESNGEAEQ